MNRRWEEAGLSSVVHLEQRIAAPSVDPLRPVFGCKKTFEFMNFSFENGQKDL